MRAPTRTLCPLNTSKLRRNFPWICKALISMSPCRCWETSNAIPLNTTTHVWSECNAQPTARRFHRRSGIKGRRRAKCSSLSDISVNTGGVYDGIWNTNETLGPFRIGGKTLISAARCPCQHSVEEIKKNDTEKEGTICWEWLDLDSVAEQMSCWSMSIFKSSNHLCIMTNTDCSSAQKHFFFF